MTFPDEYFGWCHAEIRIWKNMNLITKKKWKSEKKACFDIY